MAQEELGMSKLLRTGLRYRNWRRVVDADFD